MKFGDGALRSSSIPGSVASDLAALALLPRGPGVHNGRQRVPCGADGAGGRLVLGAVLVLDPAFGDFGVQQVDECLRVRPVVFDARLHGRLVAAGLVDGRVGCRDAVHGLASFDLACA